MIQNKAIVITNGMYGLLCQAGEKSVNSDSQSKEVIKSELLKIDKHEEQIKRVIVI
jgi:hypothetical protein